MRSPRPLFRRYRLALLLLLAFTCQKVSSTEAPTPSPGGSSGHSPPSPAPVRTPTPEPILDTPAPSVADTFEPTKTPTADEPTEEPTPVPSAEPTREPTAEPTESEQPTVAPSVANSPSAEPTPETPEPTAVPTPAPSAEPTWEPTTEPTVMPSLQPSAQPTPAPSVFTNSSTPSAEPTPETPEPTAVPTPAPTLSPVASAVPTTAPTPTPALPTTQPVPAPTPAPTGLALSEPLRDGVWSANCTSSSGGAYVKKCLFFNAAFAYQLVREYSSDAACTQVVAREVMMGQATTTGEANSLQPAFNRVQLELYRIDVVAYNSMFATRYNSWCTCSGTVQLGVPHTMNFVNLSCCELNKFQYGNYYLQQNFLGLTKLRPNVSAADLELAFTDSGFQDPTKTVCIGGGDSNTPTAAPSPVATDGPSAEPTKAPTEQTASPTPSTTTSPTSSPSPTNSSATTSSPTPAQTAGPTPVPPTSAPTPIPSPSSLQDGVWHDLTCFALPSGLGYRRCISLIGASELQVVTYLMDTPQCQQLVGLTVQRGNATAGAAVVNAAAGPLTLLTFEVQEIHSVAMTESVRTLLSASCTCPPTNATQVNRSWVVRRTDTHCHATCPTLWTKYAYFKNDMVNGYSQLWLSTFKNYSAQDGAALVTHTLQSSGQNESMCPGGVGAPSPSGPTPTPSGPAPSPTPAPALNLSSLPATTGMGNNVSWVTNKCILDGNVSFTQCLHVVGNAEFTVTTYYFANTICQGEPGGIHTVTGPLTVGGLHPVYPAFVKIKLEPVEQRYFAMQDPILQHMRTKCSSCGDPMAINVSLVVPRNACNNTCPFMWTQYSCYHHDGARLLFMPFEDTAAAGYNGSTVDSSWTLSQYTCHRAPIGTPAASIINVTNLPVSLPVEPASFQSSCKPDHSNTSRATCLSFINSHEFVHYEYYYNGSTCQEVVGLSAARGTYTPFMNNGLTSSIIPVMLNFTKLGFWALDDRTFTDFSKYCGCGTVRKGVPWQIGPGECSSCTFNWTSWTGVHRDPLSIMIGPLLNNTSGMNVSRINEILAQGQNGQCPGGSEVWRTYVLPPIINASELPPSALLHDGFWRYGPCFGSDYGGSQHGCLTVYGGATRFQMREYHYSDSECKVLSGVQTTDGTLVIRDVSPTLPGLKKLEIQTEQNRYTAYNSTLYDRWMRSCNCSSGGVNQTRVVRKGQCSSSQCPTNWTEYGAYHVSANLSHFYITTLMGTPGNATAKTGYYSETLEAFLTHSNASCDPVPHMVDGFLLPLSAPLYDGVWNMGCRDRTTVCSEIYNNVSMVRVTHNTYSDDACTRLSGSRVAVGGLSVHGETRGWRKIKVSYSKILYTPQTAEQMALYDAECSCGTSSVNSTRTVFAFLCSTSACPVIWKQYSLTHIDEVSKQMLANQPQANDSAWLDPNVMAVLEKSSTQCIASIYTPTDAPSVLPTPAPAPTQAVTAKPTQSPSVRPTLSPSMVLTAPAVFEQSCVSSSNPLDVTNSTCFSLVVPASSPTNSSAAGANVDGGTSSASGGGGTGAATGSTNDAVGFFVVNNAHSSNCSIVLSRRVDHGIIYQFGASPDHPGWNKVRVDMISTSVAAFSAEALLHWRTQCPCLPSSMRVNQYELITNANCGVCSALNTSRYGLYHSDSSSLRFNDLQLNSTGWDHTTTSSPVFVKSQLTECPHQSTAIPPTPHPTPAPTVVPTLRPTVPTSRPTAPTSKPTLSPTPRAGEPTQRPMPLPTPAPTPRATLAVPQLVLIMLNPQATGMWWVFDSATDQNIYYIKSLLTANRAGVLNIEEIPCYLILETATVNVLGTGPRCQWQSNNVLFVTFGEKYTLPQGFQAAMKAGVLRSVDGTSDPSPKYTLAVQPNPSTPKPLASLVAPGTVGACDDVILSAAQSSGNAGRELQYTWGLTWAVDGAGSSLTHAQHSLILSALAAYRDHSLARLPSQVLPGGFRYAFNVTVWNWLGQSDTAAVVVNKLALAVPALSIRGGLLLFAQPGQSIVIVAEGAPPTCGTGTINVATKVQYAWQRIYQADVSTDDLQKLQEAGYSAVSSLPLKFSGTFSPYLGVPVGALAGGQVYGFRVTYAVVMGSTVVTNTATTYILVRQSRLVSVISGGDRTVQTSLTSTATMSLHGYLSFDPDAPNDRSGFNYYWDCLLVPKGTIVGVAADASDGLQLNYPKCWTGANGAFLTSNAPIITFRTSLLLGVTNPLDVQFLFTLKVSKGARSTTSSSLVFASLDARVNVKILPFATALINPSYRLALLSVADSQGAKMAHYWTCPSNNLDLDDSSNLLSKRTSKNLVLAPNALKHSTTYRFTLNVVNQFGVSGDASLDVAVNGPPTSGRCAASPGVGNWTTQFTLNCEGWTDLQDNLPLSYGFWVVRNVGGRQTSLLLSSFGPSPSITTPLPSAVGEVSSTIIRTVIRNSAGLSVEVLYNATVIGPSPKNSSEVKDLVANVVENELVEALKGRDTGKVRQLVYSAGQLLSSANVSDNSQGSGSGGAVTDDISRLGEKLVEQVTEWNDNTTVDSSDDLTNALEMMDVAVNAYADRTKGVLKRSVVVSAIKSIQKNLNKGAELVTSAETSIANTSATSQVDARSIIQPALSALGTMISRNSADSGGDNTGSGTNTSDSDLGKEFTAVVQGALVLLSKGLVVGERSTLATEDIVLASRAEDPEEIKRNETTLGLDDNTDQGFQVPPSAFDGLSNTDSLTSLLALAPNVYSWQTGQPIGAQWERRESTLLSAKNTLSLSFTKADGSEYAVNDLREPIKINIYHDTVPPTVQLEEVRECRWWNSAVSRWSMEGCKLGVTNTTFTQCLCNHLTDFSVEVQAFQPSVSSVSDDDFRNLTAENVLNHPTTAICILTVIALYIILLPAARKHDASVMAKYEYFKAAVNKVQKLRVRRASMSQEELEQTLKRQTTKTYVGLSADMPKKPKLEKVSTAEWNDPDNSDLEDQLLEEIVAREVDEADADTSGKPHPYLFVGSYVQIIMGELAGQTGVVRYVGPYKHKRGGKTRVGLALHGPDGDNDGVHKGFRYFYCARRHGIFLKPHQIGPAPAERALGGGGLAKLAPSNAKAPKVLPFAAQRKGRGQFDSRMLESDIDPATLDNRGAPRANNNVDDDDWKADVLAAGSTGGTGSTDHVGAPRRQMLEHKQQGSIRQAANDQGDDDDWRQDVLGFGSTNAPADTSGSTNPYADQQPPQRKPSLVRKRSFPLSLRKGSLRDIADAYNTMDQTHVDKEQHSAVRYDVLSGGARSLPKAVDLSRGGRESPSAVSIASAPQHANAAASGGALLGLPSAISFKPATTTTRDTPLDPETDDFHSLTEESQLAQAMEFERIPSLRAADDSIKAVANAYNDIPNGSNGSDSDDQPGAQDSELHPDDDPHMGTGGTLDLSGAENEESLVGSAADDDAVHLDLGRKRGHRHNAGDDDDGDESSYDDYSDTDEENGTGGTGGNGLIINVEAPDEHVQRKKDNVLKEQKPNGHTAGGFKDLLAQQKERSKGPAAHNGRWDALDISRSSAADDDETSISAADDMRVPDSESSSDEEEVVHRPAPALDLLSQRDSVSNLSSGSSIGLIAKTSNVRSMRSSSSQQLSGGVYDPTEKQTGSYSVLPKLSAEERERMLGETQSKVDLDIAVAVSVLEKRKQFKRQHTVKGNKWRSNQLLATYVSSFRESHLWLSIAFRHPRDRVSSVERLSVVTALVLGTLAINAFFFGSNQLLADFSVMVLSSFMIMPVTVFMMFLFRGGSFRAARMSKEEITRRKLGLEVVRDRTFLGKHGKRIAWIFWTVWCLGCILMALVWGLQFELQQSKQLEDQGSLSFKNLIGTSTVSSRWLVSSAMSNLQDILINRPLALLALVLLRFYACCSCCCRRAK